MKNKKTMIVVMALVLVLSVVAVTYAYFASTVNNDDPQRASVQTGNLELTFNNGNGNVEGVLAVDGDPAVKTFSITNNGTYDEYANINWLNLTNTYTNGSLVYTLYKSEDNSVFTQIKTGNVPATSANTRLAKGVLVEADADASSATYKNKTLYFKLEIRLVDLGPSVNQTADVNASFMSSFTIENSVLDANSPTKLTLEQAFGDNVTWDTNDQATLYFYATGSNYKPLGQHTKTETFDSIIAAIDNISSSFNGLIEYDDTIHEYILNKRIVGDKPLAYGFMQSESGNKFSIDTIVARVNEI